MSPLTFIGLMAASGDKRARSLLSFVWWCLILAFIVMVMFRHG